MAIDNLQVTTIGGYALRLRSLVLSLGELSTPPWCRSSFLSETGLRFFERLYPRSAFSAAIYAAGKAACEVHDRAIGRRGVHHLFRLPENLEREIRLLLGGPADNDTLSGLRNDLGNIQRLTARLQEMGGSLKIEGSGPQRIGNDENLALMESYKRMAAIYFDAFTRGHHVFPYVEIERD